MTWLRLGFLVALLCWLGYVTCWPSWSGRSYLSNDRIGSRGEVRQSGSFGLDRNQAPLWNPPVSAGRFPASVRWPWQPARPGYLVEPNLSRTADRISFGVILLGLAFVALSRLSAEGRRSQLVQIALYLSLGQILAWVILVAVHATPLVLVLNTAAVLTIYSAGAGVALLLFFLQARSNTASAEQSTASGEGNANALYQQAANKAGQNLRDRAYVDRCGDVSDSQPIDNLNSPPGEARNPIGWQVLRFSLVDLGLVVTIFAVLLYGVVILPHAHSGTENIVLVALAVLYLLLPLLMICCPRHCQRWLCVFILMGVFVAARCGIGNGLAWFTGAASVLGGGAGLLIVGRRPSEFAVRSRNGSYALSLSDFITALFACLVLQVPLGWMLSALIARLAIAAGLSTATHGYELGLITTLGLGTAMMTIAACHLFSRADGTSWWKGFWLGGVVGTAAIGVMLLCYH